MNPDRERADAPAPGSDWSEEICLPDRVELVPSSDPPEIAVRETNIAVRYALREKEAAQAPGKTLPGSLEIELRSLSGAEIDTLSISKISAESMQEILNAIQTGGSLNLFQGLQPIGDPFLAPGKLKNILEVAGSLGANFETKLGVTPQEIANSYAEKLRALPEADDSREMALRYNDPIVSLSLVRHGFQMANELHVSKVLVHADAPSIIDEVLRERKDEKIIWVVSDPEATSSAQENGDAVYVSRNPGLSRESQSRRALFSALIRGDVSIDERILIFSGPDGSRHLDGFAFKVPGREFTWLNGESLAALQSFSASPVIERAIDIALRFSREGLEGKKIGACFVIGELGELDCHLNQNILNPFQGHDAAFRSLFEGRFLESLREFASNDGAVIVRPDGIADRAGSYLVAPTDKIETRAGWGARHTSAAAITSVTNSVAVVISESSGDVTVMWDGKPILEFSKS